MNIWNTIKETEQALGLQIPGAKDARESVLGGHIVASQGAVYLMGFDPIESIGDLARCQSPLHASQAVQAWYEGYHLFLRYEVAQNPAPAPKGWEVITV